MRINFYWASGSAPAWRVMLALEYKGLDYESCLLETSKKQHKTPEFLALNPRGQFPVLSDGTIVVYETRAILHYLDSQYSRPALFGTSSSEHAKLIQRSEEILAYVDPAVTRFVQPVFRNKMDNFPANWTEIVRAIEDELAGLDRQLTDEEWLGGTSYAGPDIVLVPTMQRFIRALQKAPEIGQTTGLVDWRQKYTHLASWVDQTQDMVDFERTFPPHWQN